MKNFVHDFGHKNNLYIGQDTIKQGTSDTRPERTTEFL